MENDYSALMTPFMGGLMNEGTAEGQDLTAVHPIDHQPENCSLNLVAHAHGEMMQQLSAQLLGYIHVQGPKFFESLVIDVLLAMGYGGRRRDLARCLGRSGDGGVDGAIGMDELGLDTVYIQAKRLRPGNVVPISAVRDFIGSLEAHHASKGIFVTTSHFSSAAGHLVQSVSKKVALIDGQKLTELMVRYNIGAKPSGTFQFKTIDTSYFNGKAVTSNSEASQPRK